MANQDMLTGLPNRMALIRDLSEWMADGKNGNGALLFLDMDRFTYINAFLGHAIADQLIRQVAIEIAEALAGCGSVYRLGGDGFVVHVRDGQWAWDIAGLVEGIFERFKQPVKTDGGIVHVGFHIGASLYPEHGLQPDEVIMRADIALYKAKEEGNRFVLYSPVMDESILERVELEKHLRSALTNRELELHYQPQLDLTTGEVVGFEALLRWNSKELGSVSPSKFIKVAEDANLIQEIGEWTMRRACMFIKKLQMNGFSDQTVSVNVSILQLMQDHFAEMVMEILNSLELSPECLELELTESILMESYELIGGKLMKLKEFGVRIALDDFGKGYSSLHYLLELPISTLKVDKTFIDNIDRGMKERTLAGHIVSIGRSMGLCVVAEGVETQKQMEYLVQQGCHRVQGYYFSKPIPEKAAEELLVANAGDGMSQLLSALIIEDSFYAADLDVRELRKAGFIVRYKRVTDKKGLSAALQEMRWDLVISDNIPQFGSLQALAIRNRMCRDIPFVIVSENISRHEIEQAMADGCTAFVSKEELHQLRETVAAIFADSD
ncbi:EAL domain-containing protein [Gorillibacterium massiliense]|uniref:EAL domain-containing protein n=1 Tax=Gorillibacterium massiliense TaxID=1280390 RepID=UPI0004B8D4DF|nr:EAL domain-containing protein [Gorillibacterium massiliense]